MPALIWATGRDVIRPPAKDLTVMGTDTQASWHSGPPGFRLRVAGVPTSATHALAPDEERSPSAVDSALVQVVATSPAMRFDA